MSGLAAAAQAAAKGGQTQQAMMVGVPPLNLPIGRSDLGSRGGGGGLGGGFALLRASAPELPGRTSLSSTTARSAAHGKGTSADPLASLVANFQCAMSQGSVRAVDSMRDCESVADTWETMSLASGSMRSMSLGGLFERDLAFGEAALTGGPMARLGSSRRGSVASTAGGRSSTASNSPSRRVRMAHARGREERKTSPKGLKASAQELLKQGSLESLSSGAALSRMSSAPQSVWEFVQDAQWESFQGAVQKTKLLQEASAAAMEPTSSRRRKKGRRPSGSPVRDPHSMSCLSLSPPIAEGTEEDFHPDETSAHTPSPQCPGEETPLPASSSWQEVRASSPIVPPLDLSGSSARLHQDSGAGAGIVEGVAATDVAGSPSQDSRLVGSMSAQSFAAAAPNAAAAGPNGEREATAKAAAAPAAALAAGGGAVVRATSRGPVVRATSRGSIVRLVTGTPSTSPRVSVRALHPAAAVSAAPSTSMPMQASPLLLKRSMVLAGHVPLAATSPRLVGPASAAVARGTSPGPLVGGQGAIYRRAPGVSSGASTPAAAAPLSLASAAAAAAGGAGGSGGARSPAFPQALYVGAPSFAAAAAPTGSAAAAAVTSVAASARGSGFFGAGATSEGHPSGRDEARRSRVLVSL